MPAGERVANPSAVDLETALLDDVRELLGRWRVEFAGRREAERKRLVLLALEREQVVAVAYREEAVAGRVAALAIDEDSRAVIRQTLVWIWKDEQLHAEYVRGLLLGEGGFGAKAVVYGRQVQGALSGWTSATSTHREPRTAPFRTGAAGLLVALAGATGQVPPVLRRELRYQTFRHYCRLNAALEASAELGYVRLVELCDDPDERATFERIRADEARHAEAYRVLAGALTEDDRLADPGAGGDLAARLAAISTWFVPRRLRPADIAARWPGTGTLPARARNPVPQAFGSRALVAVRSGGPGADKVAILEQCLDKAGLGEIAARAATVAVRASFMLGYDRRDRSNITSPDIVESLALYLRRHGVSDVCVLEAPTVYGNSYAHRSVGEVASYFGFVSPAYRIVDISGDMRPFTYERGFVEHAISATWYEADLRIVMPKLRTAPTDFAHLGLCTLEGTTGRIDDTVYAGRQVDYRSATMMLLDVAPPDFSVVDGWEPVADGPFGVMGCHRPARARHVYAGADALSVDEVVLADLGITDPRRVPMLRMVYHWSGLSPATVPVDGERPNLHDELRGAHASWSWRALGLLSGPVYEYLSNGGKVFVPALDEASFPPLAPISPLVRGVQWATQQAFGLHAPAAGPPAYP
jgi:uncharacterized protein (DUF362 family)